jgi:hypothetical protein
MHQFLRSIESLQLKLSDWDYLGLVITFIWAEGELQAQLLRLCLPQSRGYAS